MEGKVVDFQVEGTNLVIIVDPNKNGVALLTLKVNVAEVPVEVAALFQKN